MLTKTTKCASFAITPVIYALDQVKMNALSAVPIMARFIIYLMTMYVLLHARMDITQMLLLVWIQQENV